MCTKLQLKSHNKQCAKNNLLRLFVIFILMLVIVIPVNADYSSSFWIDRAEWHMESGKYQDALNAYDRAIEINPNIPHFWSNKGNTLEALGRYQEANVAFAKADTLKIQHTHITWILSGGPSPTDQIIVDDDLEVIVNGITVFKDDDEYSTLDGRASWNGEPIIFSALPGDELNIIATNPNGGEIELSPLYLNQDGQAAKLSDGVVKVESKVNEFFNRRFIISNTPLVKIVEYSTSPVHGNETLTANVLWSNIPEGWKLSVSLEESEWNATRLANDVNKTVSGYGEDTFELSVYTIDETHNEAKVFACLYDEKMDWSDVFDKEDIEVIPEKTQEPSLSFIYYFITSIILILGIFIISKVRSKTTPRPSNELNKQTLSELSKLMAYILRHDKELKYQVELDEKCYADIDQLVKAISSIDKWNWVNRKHIEEVALKSLYFKKRRFLVNKNKIKAAYRITRDCPTSNNSDSEIITNEREPKPISQEVFTPSLATPSTFPPELQAKYTDLEFLGKGAFARVFKAIRNKDDQTVAIKVPISLDEATGKTFLKEIKAWEELVHPNITRLYNMNIMPLPYFEMEYVENKSLEKLEKPLEVEKAARIIFDISEGLKYAHSKGRIHRDLKPDNVLLTNDLNPKISDWGLSKIVTESKTSSRFSFSPLYAAPEQISPKKFGQPGIRTDIYQLGVIFYELVTGRPPFEGEDFSEIGFAIINDKPVPPSTLNPECGGVDEIILKSLNKQPNERYPSMQEFQHDLAEYLKLENKKSLSKSVNDLKRSCIYCSDLVLIHARIGDVEGALKYAVDMKNYAGDEWSDEMEDIMKHLDYLVNRKQSIGDELMSRIGVVLHQLKMGR